ncbi:TetR family transcriptional regulator [Haematobacter massiliensis]|nr:TetR family transcriptional regulator [Haematobacter massiliensis]
MRIMAKPVRRRVGRPSREEREATAPGFDRREQIVAVSAALFAEKGYDRTSMRDIAAATGILSGSLYYYFSSKEALFVEVFNAGMAVLTAGARAAAAMEAVSPWDRLERIAAAHCRALLENSGLMIMVVPRFPEGMDEYRAELVAGRDAYESIIAEAVKALDLPPDIDPQLFRLQFLGALNWSQSWYRQGLMSPEEIGIHLVRMLRPR